MTMMRPSTFTGMAARSWRAVASRSLTSRTLGPALVHRASSFPHSSSAESLAGSHTPFNNTANTISTRFFSAAATEDETSTTQLPSMPYQLTRRNNMRNVAIIAHVDHGKTTLVDEILNAAKRSLNGWKEEDDIEKGSRLMDGGELEKERGITITSKVTRVKYSTTSNDELTFNIVDTPGHSDFSGEVDRILSMVDGVCLLVDAVEGPMTQTKYVLSRALANGLKPIVVLNKCDRPEAYDALDSGSTEDRLNELFIALGATEDQLDYPVLYASARQGWISIDPFDAMSIASGDSEPDSDHFMNKLLDVIQDTIPAPAVKRFGKDEQSDDEQVPTLEGPEFADDPFGLAIVSVGTDAYLGRTCTGRIVSGSIGMGDEVALIPRSFTGEAAPTETSSVTGLFCYEGVSRKEMDEPRAYAGDCVTIAGVPASVAVGDTLTSSKNPILYPIDTPPLAPPTLSMEFGANNGPLAGTEPNTIVASSKIRDRLVSETDNNVTLKLEKSASDSERTTVFARGELQLGILIETMRREGFEMMLTPPRVLTSKDPETGEKMEPFEEVFVDVDSEYAGTVISALTEKRKGVVIDMSESGEGKSRIVLHVPSRGLLGFSSEIATVTKGSAVVNHVFLENRPHLGLLESSYGKPKMVCNASGKATGFALQGLSARGTLFVKPGDLVYSGMVVGELTKPGPDLEVNATKSKELTNMRTKATDENVKLAPPKQMTLEEMIGYMSQDEVIEVTPNTIRLRKAELDSGARQRIGRNRAKQMRETKK